MLDAKPGTHNTEESGSITSKMKMETLLNWRHLMISNVRLINKVLLYAFMLKLLTQCLFEIFGLPKEPLKDSIRCKFNIYGDILPQFTDITKILICIILIINVILYYKYMVPIKYTML